MNEVVLRKPHLLSVKRPTAINRAEGTDEKMFAKRRRDVAALRWYLEGKDLQELADHHQMKIETIRGGMEKLIPVLFFRIRDRSGLDKMPTGPAKLLKNSAFWLEKLNANEDRLLVLDNSNLPP